MSASEYSGPFFVENALSRYYSYVEQALAKAETKRVKAKDPHFSPGFSIPIMTEPLRKLFGASNLAMGHMGTYRGRTLWLLDLMQNPETRTTKTFGSLVIVARAIRYIRETDERVMIMTPSAANKATALRDAALRAIDLGLVTSRQLQTAVVVPTSAAPKLWSSRLASEGDLSRRNPVLMYPGQEREAVKPMTRQFIDSHEASLLKKFGVRLWQSLHVDNYVVADVVRASFELEALGKGSEANRLHVHTVSSAYGLLGHYLGRSLLKDSPNLGAKPRYLMVQHLETPDVVLDIHFGRVDKSDMPEYKYDTSVGVYQQNDNPYFPTVTLDPSERLEPTFYTRQPPTLQAIRELISSTGGTGLVVSLHECLSRYAEVRALIAAAGMNRLPADPRKIREWALVMATVGVLNAIDRGLVDEEEIVIHGSGCYSEDEFEPFPQHRAEHILNSSDMEESIYRAATIEVS